MKRSGLRLEGWHWSHPEVAILKGQLKQAEPVLDGRGMEKRGTWQHRHAMGPDALRNPWRLVAGPRSICLHL